MTRAEAPAHPPAIRAALAGAIDYAGLFPPAALPMAEAIVNYSEYRRSPDAWALGRFIVPAGRLAEVTRILSERPELSDRWVGARLSATITADLRIEADLRPEVAAIERFNLEWRGRSIVVDAVEAKVVDAASIDRLRSALAPSITGYGEVPWGPGQEGLVARLARNRLAAKLRMGGVSPALFPSPDDVARALLAIVRWKVPFKATAGLHHPLRGEYRLTEEPGSPRAPMFGSLNLILGSLLALDGMEPELIERALVESDPTSFTMDRDGLGWRDHRFAPDTVARLRGCFRGFGSCSFREPMDELLPVLGR
jgi:hypothetical protein